METTCNYLNVTRRARHHSADDHLVQERTSEGLRRHLVELSSMTHSGIRNTYLESTYDVLFRVASNDVPLIYNGALIQHTNQLIYFKALEYLLKFFEDSELNKLVRKSSLNWLSDSSAPHDKKISSHSGNQEAGIGLPEIDGLLFVQVKDILFCKGESAQSSIHFKDEKQHIVSRTLKECEEILEPYDFCRIHKSYLLNLRHITRYHRGDGGYVTLSDGRHLDVSRTYRDELLGRLQKF